MLTIPHLLPPPLLLLLLLLLLPRRALKTKHETPKYGLIYHASLIGQSQPKYKGKISRVLAAKCALAIRVDALGDTTDATVGLEAREKVGLGWVWG
jgi:RNA processing factor Prp31